MCFWLVASEPKEVAGFTTSREITSAALMHSSNAAETELLFALRHYKTKMEDYCISCIPFEHALVAWFDGEQRKGSYSAVAACQDYLWIADPGFKPSERQEQRKNRQYVNSLVSYMWGKQFLLQNQSGIPASTTFKSPMGAHCLWASAGTSSPRSHHLM